MPDSLHDLLTVLIRSCRGGCTVAELWQDLEHEVGAKRLAKMPRATEFYVALAGLKERGTIEVEGIGEEAWVGIRTVPLPEEKGRLFV